MCETQALFHVDKRSNPDIQTWRHTYAVCPHLKYVSLSRRVTHNYVIGNLNTMHVVPREHFFEIFLENYYYLREHPERIVPRY